jgi:DNA-binding response OmpR family regulator
MKLLLVEDDKLTADFVRFGLQEDGHAVDLVATAAEGLARARNDVYDALILDLILPDGTGNDITNALREEGSTVPILMLTASASETIVHGLAAGADDYLTKPFAMEELRARVRTLARHTDARDTGVLRVGSLTLNRSVQQVFRNEELVRLTPTEYKLLEYFLVRPHQAISREELLEGVWDARVDPNSNVVDAHVARLRMKLNEIHGAPQIETARGFGFILDIDGSVNG